MHASLREGGLFLTALCAPRSQAGLPVGCTLPLAGVYGGLMFKSP